MAILFFWPSFDIRLLKKQTQGGAFKAKEKLKKYKKEGVLFTSSSP